MGWIWAASLLAVIYFSLTPRLELPYDFSFADKVCHIISYLWLAALPFFAFSTFKAFLSASMGMFLLGICLEIVQCYIPGRSFSFGDIVADGIGVVLGMWLASMFRQFRLHEIPGDPSK